MIYTKRHAQFQCSPKSLVHKNMFYKPYLGKKKPAFFAYYPEQDHPAIFKSSKNNDLFQNRQTYSHRILEIYWDFHDMVSVRLTD